MKENQLLAAFLTLARPVLERADGGVLFKHADALTTGVPDVSLTLNGRTSWWEWKVDRGDGIGGTELQRLTMKRLAAAGTAYYVVYHVDGETMIVRPQDVVRTEYEPWRRQEGIDHQYVMEFMRDQHYAA